MKRNYSLTYENWLRSFFNFLLIGLFGFLLQSCQKDEIYQVLEDPDIKSASVLQDPIIYWGPQTFYANKGKTISETRIITNPNFEHFDVCYVLKVKNGEGASYSVSSASIIIDGIKLVTTSDFKKKQQLITKNICSLKPDSKMEVKVTGNADSYIEVWIEGQLKPNLFMDLRDGRVYKTVTIGNQTWMADNLAWLPEANLHSDKSISISKYYVYGHNGTNTEMAKNTNSYKTFGVWYNWPAALNACPAGWHLPSNAEWSQLENYLIDNGFGYEGSGSDIAKSLSSKTNWWGSTYPGTPGNNPEANNTSGFNALPGGFILDGYFQGVGGLGFWWTSTLDRDEFSLLRDLDFANPDLYLFSRSMDYGNSVRCIKD